MRWPHHFCFRRARAASPFSRTPAHARRRQERWENLARAVERTISFSVYPGGEVVVGAGVEVWG